MELKFKDFVCYPCDVEVARDRFDVYWEKNVAYKESDKAVKEGKAKIGEKRKVTELVGYGMRLNEIVNKAIKYLINDTAEVMTLKSYLAEYDRIEKEILEIVK